MMKAKIIKLTEEHYIVVDNSEIKDGEWFYNTFNDNQAKIQQRKGNWKTCFNQHKITHSTQPLEDVIVANKYIGKGWVSIKPFSLSEIEELLYGYNVEKLALEEHKFNHKSVNEISFRLGFIEGFKTAQSFNGKMFSLEQVMKAIKFDSYENEFEGCNYATVEDFIQSLQQTEWECEIDENGKITLL